VATGSTFVCALNSDVEQAPLPLPNLRRHTPVRDVPALNFQWMIAGEVARHSPELESNSYSVDRSLCDPQILPSAESTYRNEGSRIEALPHLAFACATVIGLSQSPT
jgi:hypothetical protein